MKLKLLLLSLSVLSLGPSQALAAKFANQFTEFELPPQWSCSLEGAEWVCQSTNEQKKRDAIIVLAAKLKGDQDSLDQYQTYLNGAKTYTSIQGKPVKSEPKYAKTISLNAQPWVDALHLESEIPGFYTRYLATVKDDIGVLITYSISKARYSEYVNDFESMVKTLKVFRKAGGINVQPGSGNIFQNTSIPQTVSGDTVFPGGAPNIAGGSDSQKQKPKDDDMLFYLLVAGVAGVALLIYKKKRSGG